jgi:hypothetical protein
MKKSIRHQIFTIYITPDMHAHAYLIFTDESIIERVREKIFDALEEKDLTPMLPMILETELTNHPEDIAFIQDAIGKESAEIKKNIETVTDFHLSMWMWHESHPDDKKILELH